MDFTHLVKWFLPPIIIIASLVLGRFCKKWVISKLLDLTSKTKLRFDDVLIRSLKSSVVLWCLLLGIYIALNFVSLPDKILALTQKILLVLVLFTAFLFLARFLGDLIQIYEDKIKGALPGASIFKNLIKGFVLVIGFLMILHTIGISITPLITTLGIGGLAVALALQDTLANLFAGLHIVATKKVRPGDYIKIETGEEGYVTDITWRDTTIRQLPNNIVIIPNSKLASAIVTNYYFPERELAVLVQVGVSYDSDLEKVEKVTIEVAKEVMQEVSGGVPEFNPFIRYHTFDDFSINFTVILRAKEFVDQYLVKHEFVKRLKKRYDQEGIEIPFPIRTVFLKKD
ncbi:MAG TPA: mechanosensitive ion channel family protein [Candidatus Desulfofervidus auxilii]|uniref:Mechanosensitive ion channel family protein n=1 Tax=Desulfofervidus auxilii TaxID=1621989 RepID=A0A7C2AK77_DESA2|nr:mechanosensitive ion channel family protein [Candidatus Desulfofervidus auxilii]